MANLKVVSVAAPLRQQVVDTLRNAIMEGVWLPGHKLGERELCEQTGVSRTLIREALRQLESERLVEAIPNRGLFVAKVSAADAEDLYRVKPILYALAGRLVAENASPDVAIELRKALDELSYAVNKDDLPKAIKAKSHFYGLLFKATGNKLLCELLDNLHARTSLLRVTALSAPGRFKASLKEIAKIVRAIEKQDPDGAAKACTDHVEAAAKVALKIVAEGQELKTAHS